MKMKHEDLDNPKNFESPERLNSDTSAPLTRFRSALTFFNGVFIKNHNNEKGYHFKTKMIERAQFESYCAAIHRFIVTEKYVPSYKAYKGSIDPSEEWFENIMSIVDDIDTTPIQKFSNLVEQFFLQSNQPNEQMHGVASKIIDFVSNFDDPLREEDLVMKCQPFFNEFIIARIKKVLNENIYELEETIEKLSIGQRAINFFLPPNAYYQLEFCKNILDSLSSADTQMIQGWWNNSNCPKKLKPLLTSWIDQTTTDDNLELSIPIFELLDAQYPALLLDNTLKCSSNGKEYSISFTLLDQYRLIKGLGRTLIVRSIFNDWDENNSNFSKRGHMLDFEYSKMNVLMSGPFWHSYLKLFDNTLRNKGKTINESIIEEAFDSEIFQEAFKFLGFERRKWSPDLISHFPDIGEEGQYVHYHPTKRHFFNRVLFGLVTSLLIKCRDNSESEIVQIISTAITNLLATLDKTLLDSLFPNKLTDMCYIGFLALKGVLSGESMNDLLKREQHRYLFTKLSHKWDDFYKQHQILFEHAEVFFLEKLGSKTKTFSREDNEIYQLLSYHPVFIYHKNISLLKYILTSREQYRAIAELHLDNVTTKNNLVEDEDQNIQDLKSVLIYTEQFQLFIMNHGDEAMRIILEEFSETKGKYQNKQDIKPHFKEFVANLDLNRMKQEFLEIKEMICFLNTTESEEEDKDTFIY